MPVNEAIVRDTFTPDFVFDDGALGTSDLPDPGHLVHVQPSCHVALPANSTS
jgi:hypothetical protein